MAVCWAPWSFEGESLMMSMLGCIILEGLRVWMIVTLACMGISSHRLVMISSYGCTHVRPLYNLPIWVNSTNPRIFWLYFAWSPNTSSIICLLFISSSPTLGNLGEVILLAYSHESLFSPRLFIGNFAHLDTKNTFDVQNRHYSLFVPVHISSRCMSFFSWK